MLIISPTLKKHVDYHNKKNYLYQIICVFKVNDNHYIRHRSLTTKDVESENIHIRCNFSQIDEMRISFCSYRKLLTYNCYITQPMQAIERKLNQILSKNPEFVKYLNAICILPPYMRK